MVEHAPLVRVRDVSCYFGRNLGRKRDAVVRAVDGVSFDIMRGEVFALVGESGSGKSTLARCITGICPVTGGNVDFDGLTVNGGGGVSRAPSYRSRIQMVFQDPYSSLNPRLRVFDIIAEPLRVQTTIRDRATVQKRIAEMLDRVGLSSGATARFPHEFSGGERQRISIARALVSRPELLVCDEPTSALDVSVQAQVLNLLADLRAELGLTCLLLSHDLAVVQQLSDRVGVMRNGRLCESGATAAVFAEPQHSYTRLLIDSTLELERSPQVDETQPDGI
jgi:ABC-type glutathione transport system ATPase component